MPLASIHARSAATGQAVAPLGTATDAPMPSWSVLLRRMWKNPACAAVRREAEEDWGR
jgi:hypothetical protein